MKPEPSLVIVLVYVDDILVIDPNASLCQDFIKTLSELFLVKDLGPLHCFLGLEVQRTTYGIFLSQSKYSLDFLLKPTWKAVNLASLILLLKSRIKHEPCCPIQRNTCPW